MNVLSSYRSTLISIFFAFIFGSFFLESIGIQYVSVGGAPIFKIHLYSYITIISFILLSAHLGINKISNALGAARYYWWLSLLSIIFVIMLTVFRQGVSGAAYLVDTILTPVLIVPIVAMFSDEQKKATTYLLAYLLLANSLIAITEVIFTTNIMLNVERWVTQFRASSLLNHPLNNALITASLAPLFIRSTKLSPVIYCSIILLSLFAFGGRTALFIYILSMLYLSFGVVKMFMSEGVAVSKLWFAVFQIAAFSLLILLVFILYSTSIGNRIFDNLFLESSAQARFDILILLDFLTFHEWVFGASSSMLDNVEYITGVGIIENYLLGWLVNYGLVGMIPLILSSWLLLIFAFRYDASVKIAIFAFIAISISNNSLMTKTPALFFLYIALFTRVDLCFRKHGNQE